MSRPNTFFRLFEGASSSKLVDSLHGYLAKKVILNISFGEEDSPTIFEVRYIRKRICCLFSQNFPKATEVA